MRHGRTATALTVSGLVLAVAGGQGALAAPSATYAVAGTTGTPIALSPDGAWVVQAEDDGVPAGTTHITVARTDGSLVHAVPHAFLRTRFPPSGLEVTVANDGSATVQARDGAFFVPPGTGDAVRYRVRRIEARMAGDRVLGTAVGGDALVLARPARVPKRLPGRLLGVAANGQRALTGASGRMWQIDADGRAQPVAAPAALGLLRFDASLRRALGIMPGRRVVRAFELRGLRLVPVGRYRSSTRMNAYISPNGRWISTARRAGRSVVKYHVGAFGGRLRSLPAWRTVNNPHARLTVADDGGALYAVAAAMGGPEVARTLDARASRGFTAGCHGRRVDILGAGVFTCFGRGFTDDLDPAPVEVQLPTGIIALAAPGWVTGETAVASADGRVVAFTATPEAGGAARTWVARIAP